MAGLVNRDVARNRVESWDEKLDSDFLKMGADSVKKNTAIS
jgi:hypothetical protein